MTTEVDFQLVELLLRGIPEEELLFHYEYSEEEIAAMWKYIGKKSPKDLYQAMEEWRFLQAEWNDDADF